MSDAVIIISFLASLGGGVGRRIPHPQPQLQRLLSLTLFVVAVFCRHPSSSSLLVVVVDGAAFVGGGGRPGSGSSGADRRGVHDNRNGRRRTAPGEAAEAFVNRILTASVSSSSSSTSLGATYKKVFVAGGSRGVGRHVVEKLVSQGTEVVALVRDGGVADELNSLDGVAAVVGDAFDQKSVENAMDGCDAAGTCYARCRRWMRYR